MGFLAAALQVGKVIGLGAVRLMTMGAIFTGTSFLTDKNRELARDFNGRITRGYDFNVKPKVGRGISLVKGNK